MQKKEVEIVARPGAGLDALRLMFKQWYQHGWTLKQANEDFTLFIFERDFDPVKKAIEKSSPTVNIPNISGSVTQVVTNKNVIVTTSDFAAPVGSTRVPDAIRETDAKYAKMFADEQKKIDELQAVKDGKGKL